MVLALISLHIYPLQIGLVWLGLLKKVHGLNSVIKWKKGQVGLVLGGSCRSGGSEWLMGQLSVGQWIAAVINFPKIYGLCGHVMKVNN